MEYKYIFSIVMAVYNSEPFLRETLDSILDQDVSEFDIPFEEIVQVIMVDDGSTDGSAEIIDEYAAAHPNFLAVHKPNGGVASARNEGLKYIEGKYMNFLDSDDKFSDNVFITVYNFLKQYHDRTDVVTMPLEFFDAKTGPHWQNGKFNGGTRVIDLFNEYDASLMFVNASFFNAEYKDKVTFDGKLVCGEDIKYICTILSEKMTLGLVKNCKYLYRRRSSGEESLIQTSKKKHGWYFDYFTNLIDWGVSFAMDKWGYVPYYFQNLFVRDIAWRFKEKYESTALSVIGEEEYERYKKVLYNSLKYFDDEIIMRQTHIWKEHKYMMLEKKHECLPEMCVYNDDIRLRFGNTLFCWLSGCVTYVDKLDINGNKLTIDGHTMLLGVADDEPVQVMFRVNNPDLKEERLIPCTITERDSNQYRLGDVLFRGISFIGTVELTGDEEKAEISIVCVVRGINVTKKDIRFYKFAPIGAEYNNSYFIKDGYIVTRWKHFISFKKCGRFEAYSREKKLLKELKSSGKSSDKKAYYARKFVRFYSKLKHKKIWLISDRVNKADDNGEALFRYLCQKKDPGIDIYFVIEEGSPDYERLKQYGKVVPYFSHKHKMLHLLADVIISSHADDFVISPFRKYTGAYRDYIASQTFVFLQHGVTKDDQSLWLNSYYVPLKGLVTSAECEYNSILSGDYYYAKDVVWLTGMPRYDLLYNNDRKCITIMPTWRAYLDNQPKFLKSLYHNFYASLFNDSRLIAAAKQYGYELYFKPHPRMLEYSNMFSNSEDFKIYEPDVSYRDIFAENSLLVTDYSSTAFDFAYLKKPVIYCQFDKEEFFNGSHMYTKGYFDYERDGFGEVTYDLDSTVDTIIEYMKNGCQLKDKYRQRIDGFYTFNDKNNCQRVYEKIKELGNK